MLRLKAFFINRKGQALVELTLILPILLLLVMGCLDMGRILHNYMILTSASREGARLAVVGATDSEIKERVKDVAYNLGLSDSDINIMPEKELRTRGTAVKVNLVHNVELLTPFLDNIVISPFPLSAETIMRME